MALNDIKLKLSNYILSRLVKKSKRERAVYNLSTAKNIAVIYNATHEKNYKISIEFIKFLSSKGIQISSIGFVDQKELLEYYTQTKSSLFFCKKNLNWWGKPKNEAIDGFINNKFDMLIDLSVESFFPIEYIVGLSNAKFKVGRFTNKNSYADFMIDIKKNTDLSFLIEQFKKYLTIINS